MGYVKRLRLVYGSHLHENRQVCHLETEYDANNRLADLVGLVLGSCIKFYVIEIETISGLCAGDKYKRVPSCGLFVSRALHEFLKVSTK